MSESQATKAGSARGKGAVSRLLAFARPAPCAHVPGLRALGRLDAREFLYVCIWLVARDLIAVAPTGARPRGSPRTAGGRSLSRQRASFSTSLASCARTSSAFRCASNIAQTHYERASMLTLPPGLLRHARHRCALRRVVDGCAAGHRRACSPTSCRTPRAPPPWSWACSVLLFALDWRLGRGLPGRRWPSRSAAMAYHDGRAAARSS